MHGFLCNKLAALCDNAIDGEVHDWLLSSSGYGCCWSSGASPRTTTDPGRRGEGERAIHTYVSSRMKPRTHARNVKTAGPLLLHRSLLFAPLPSLSFRRLFPSCFSSLPTSPVGLPHGQRIRKRGYTRWINFIGVPSLSLSFSLTGSPLRRRLYRYCSLLCFTLCSAPCAPG